MASTLYQCLLDVPCHRYRMAATAYPIGFAIQESGKQLLEHQ